MVVELGDRETARRTRAGIVRVLGVEPVAEHPELGIAAPAELRDQPDPQGVALANRTDVLSIERTIARPIEAEIRIEAESPERHRQPRLAERVEVIELGLARVGVELEPLVEGQECAMAEQHEPVDPGRENDEVSPTLAFGFASAVSSVTAKTLLS
jgi:hypothetical protein